ncbi:MAG: NAD(P)-dependent dehydrogenase (short-subunit alcohol dehydrogenase family) [Parvibaculaceae bacterium]|jgi:NAD(P)-dependent dehydrogenase (short-subunit alcohol dehydrogenase family)
MAGLLENRLALITGASRGIGRAVALAYAAQGAHVILVARTTGALEEVDDEIQAAGGKATLVPLNITDGEAIDRLGATIFERWGHLDILVGNAGVLGTLTPVGHIAPKDWDEVMNINLTANWRLIRSMDPLLRRSDAGRALFVTSGAAESCKPYWGGYAASKAALNAIVTSWAHEMENTPVRVNLINPGATRTDMRAKAMPGEDPMSLPSPADLAPLFVQLALPDLKTNGEIVDFKQAD